jgi:hypothetical protein
MAYNYLQAQNLNVSKEDEIWRIIDEPYEYYQSIAKTVQLKDQQCFLQVGLSLWVSLDF